MLCQWCTICPIVVWQGVYILGGRMSMGETMLALCSPTYGFCQWAWSILWWDGLVEWQLVRRLLYWVYLCIGCLCVELYNIIGGASMYHFLLVGRGRIVGKCLVWVHVFWQFPMYMHIKIWGWTILDGCLEWIAICYIWHVILGCLYSFSMWDLGF